MNIFLYYNWRELTLLCQRFVLTQSEWSHFVITLTAKFVFIGHPCDVEGDGLSAVLVQGLTHVAHGILLRCSLREHMLLEQALYIRQLYFFYIGFTCFDRNHQ